MSDAVDGRVKRRVATRQKISDAATCLFMKHGFDAVTVDEIAASAGVSRMTVFNHFARKEDMIFDLDDVGRQDIAEALRDRPDGTGPVESLRLFAHRAVAERRPYVCFWENGSDAFVRTVQASETLTARARAIRDELSDLIAEMMAKSVGRPVSDPIAKLAASLIVTSWVVALMEAHRTFHTSGNVAKSYKIFLALIDQGSAGATAAVRGTRYA